MKNTKKYILYLFIFLIITGFTIVDYDEYKEPNWLVNTASNDKVDGYIFIKDKVKIALNNVNSKGLHIEDVKIHISPYRYIEFDGMSSWTPREVIIAKNDYDVIYHELGHIYSFQDWSIIQKYNKAMQKYYPNHKPIGNEWETNITEDFAEEFKRIFTGTEKRTAYPPFPNFYEWLLKNTQPTQITRKEAFDKLGGTQKLINEGVVIGNTLGDYMLDRPIKRGELATVLVRLGKSHKKGVAPFKDIRGKWYEDYVNQIYSTGLIKGYPDGSFKGDNFITRYELHVILDRIK